MVDRIDTFRKEVDEELQRERLRQLWERYSGFIIAGAALIILGVGGWKFAEWRQQQSAEATGQRFMVAARALADNKTADAEKVLAELATGSGGYPVLARLRLAAADVAAGRTSEAAQRFEAVAAERGVDPLIADFARLQTALLKIDQADWTDVSNRLRPLSLEGNPWRHAAREMLGVAALKAGRQDDARQAFEQILGDRTTPPGISERARTMMAMITEGELSKTPAPAPKAVPAEPAPKAAAPAAEPKKK